MVVAGVCREGAWIELYMGWIGQVEGKIFNHSGFSGLENFQITGDLPTSKKAGLIENLSCFDLAN